MRLRKANRLALKVALVYVLFAVVWDIFSDLVLETYLSKANAIYFTDILKDCGFALITGGLIYWLLKRSLRRWEQVAEKSAQAEAVLAQSNSLLNAALEATADGILVVDGHGQVTGFNQKFLQLWQIPAALAASKDDQRLLQYATSQLKEPERFQAKVQELYQNPQAESWDELKFRDGRVFERYSKPQHIGDQVVGRVWSFRDVSKRKRAEGTLRLTEFTMNHAMEALFWVAPSSQILFVNDAACHLLGYSRAELVGKTVPDIDPGFPPEKWPAHWAEVKQRNSFTFETTNRTKDGRSFPSEITVNYMRFDGQEYTCTHMRDITARKSAETKTRALTRLSERLCIVTEIQEAAVAVTDTALELFQWDACYLLRYDDASNTTTDLIFKDTINGERRTVPRPPGYVQLTPVLQRVMGEGAQLLLRQKATDHSGITLRFGDTSRVSLSLMYVALHLHGEVIGFLSVQSYRPNAYTAQDLATLQALADHCAGAVARIDAESALQLSDFSVNQASLATLWVTRDARIVRANAAACAHLGYAEAELLQHAITDLNPDIPPERWPEHWQKLRDLKKMCFESRHRRKDGEIFPVEVELNWFEFGGQEYSFAFVRDITGRRQIEARIQRLNRTHAVLSEINQSMVREQEPQALFTLACAIAVETGKFRMAWIGKLNITTQQLEPVAAAGVVEDYPKLTRIDLRDANRNQGPAGRCCQSGQHSVCNDIERDPLYQPWRDEALKRGYRSAAGFPLKMNSRVIGVFSFYADEPDFFDAEELQLLDDLAADISFALEMFDSQSRYKAIFENAPDAVFLLNAEGEDPGCILACNHLAAQMHGYRQEEIIGKNIAALNVDESAAGVPERLRRMAAGEQLTFEVQHRRQDGSIFPVEVTTTQITVAGRCCVIAFDRDITERKQALTALEESQLLYRSLVMQLPIGIFQKDQAGRYVFVNPEFCRIHGQTAEAFLGKTVLELIADEPAKQQASQLLGKYAADGDDHFRKIMQTGKPVRADEVYDLADGTRRHLSAMKFPILKADGQIRGVQAVIVDVTERNRAEEAHARLATVVEQASESIVITDIKGKITYVNPAFERNSGFTAAEVIGQTPRILKSGQHDAEFYRKLWAVLHAGEVWSGHFINRRKDGKLYEEDATISPIRDAAGRVINYMAVKRDTTREAQLETQLRQAQKMEAIGQLAGGVAHDFNNILASTLMQVELLAGEPMAAEIREGLEQIRADANRAANLTRQLLLFSRRQVMQPRVLDLNELITNLVKMLQRIIGEHVQMQLNLHPAELLTRADAGMLDQVLMNLVVNARDAMPGGGQLRIETSAKLVTGDDALLHAEAVPGRHVCFSVSDTGGGIPPEILPQIFEPFFTTKAEGKGTGLGLATVYGIVKQHRGWIQLVNRPGQGVTFQIFLPAHTAPVEAGGSDTQFRSRRGTETILLVEDEAGLLKVTQKILERQGYRVLTATNGKDALRLWQAHHAAIALLLTDMVMPGGLSGQELARLMQKDKPALKIAFASGYSSTIAGQEFRLGAGETFLQKPFEVDQLLKTIRASLDSDRTQ